MENKIMPGHGSGGKLMNDMIEKVIRASLGDTVQMDDSALLKIGDTTIAFTTDTFTITPVFFPGGDIGSLAVNGTVNDLAVMGAEPVYMSCALILEEGFDMDEMRDVLESMGAQAKYAGVEIVTGDTKVVPRNKGDKIYINTTGIGIIRNKAARREIRPGDKIIINGTIGDHGTAVMAERNKLSFSKGLISDCAPLNRMISGITGDYGQGIKFMRDPTRGGVASVLNEIVRHAQYGAKLYPVETLPVKAEVKGVSEILGIDPLYIANEGKVIIISETDMAESIVNKMKTFKEGTDACIIGEITEEFPGRAYIDTAAGGRRILPLLTEEQLPRIC